MRQAGPLVMAIDVGGTKTAIVATREMPVDGLVPAGGTAVFPTPHDPDRFVDAVEGSVGDVVPTGERVVAVGIGAPGPVDVERGFIASSPNIGWRDVPIGELVRRRLGGIPVAMEDDSNAGALGEVVAGAGRGIDPYVYLPLGTGLGAGIIVGGQVLHGVGGGAGEVGHMALDRRDGPRCSCGRRNCIETWCAGAGLAKRAREVWPSERSADGSPAPRDAEAVFALAESGDPDAIELVGRARHALATAIAVILASVAPAAVTIGGSIGLSQPAFVRSAFEEATELVDRSTGSRAKLREPQLGGESVITGAAVLGLRAVSSGTTSGLRPRDS